MGGHYESFTLHTYLDIGVEIHTSSSIMIAAVGRGLFNGPPVVVDLFIHHRYRIDSSLYIAPKTSTTTLRAKA